MAKDPYKYFRIEGRELVEGLSRDALALERAPGDVAVIARMLRVAHTLKGAARVVRRSTIAELAHAVESVLAPHRDGTPLEAAAVHEIIRSLDQMSLDLQMLDAAATPNDARPPPDEIGDTVRIDVKELDRLLRSLYESGVQVKALRVHTDALERAVRVAGIASDQLAARGGADSGRVQALVDELGASVVSARRALRSGLDHVEVELSEARETADRLRLLPAHAVFDVLERAVRDAAQALGKRAELRLHGGETRLDAHVLSALRSALLHVVRNAVAHGIETPSHRAAAGKPETGVVELAVERRGGRVAFTCRDDGSGVDVDAVRAAAVRRGLATASQIEALPREAVLELLLRGGTTTTATVDAVSGRGIGLDVVRDVIARLKGEIELRSEAGRGTHLEIRVPISLTSVNALVVSAGDMVVAIPLDAVVATERVRRESIARAPEGDSIVFQGSVVPCVTLRTLLGVDDRQARLARNAVSTLIVRAGADSAAVIVDHILGTSAVILRHLPDAARADAMVAGASLDAEGVPQLVLDPAGVVAAAKTLAAEVGSVPPRPPPILVIDDSLTTRMLEQSILESAGYDVELATSAEEGLEKARKHRFSLFLVDVEMPGMDGFEFVAHTRTDPVLRNVPAILVTSRSAPEDRMRGREVGAHAYVVKSEFEQGTLLEVIRELVS